MRRLGALQLQLRQTLPLLVLITAACAQAPTDTPVRVGTVVAARATPAVMDEARPDVSIAVFDANIPSDPAARRHQRIHVQVREAESIYLAYLLRQALVDSGQWGAVRLLPVSDPTAELQVSGAIIQSDGNELQLRVQVRDSTGRVWLDQHYADSAGHGDYAGDEATGREPFQDLYDRIASDLLILRRQLSSRELTAIEQVSLLRYAKELSPDAFADYLQTQADGTVTIHSLPAASDPMLARAQRIREHEYSYIDAVDEQFGNFHRDMRTVYDAWRRYSHEQALYIEDHEERAARRQSRARDGSFEAMRETYDAYRWQRIQEQDMWELASGFDNEMAPTEMELEGRVVSLSGTMEAQYQEWRRILKRYYLLESDIAG